MQAPPHWSCLLFMPLSLIKESPMSESSGAPYPDEVHGPRRPYRVALCPLCGSPNTQAKNYGKKLGGALGTCAGVISSLSATAKGATAGAIVAVRATSPTTPLNSITAAVLGAFAGGAMGCIAGAGLGQVIDETVLNNHRCLRCGHSFSSP